jgi:hypothetical protein
MTQPFLKERCGERALRGLLWMILALAGWSLLPGAELHFTPSKPDVSEVDRRPEKLEAFFSAYRCPGPLHVTDYLRAADTYGIDYRLLPALSVRESTCGKHERANNRWGWDSARTGFASVASGIEFIARQLASGRSYRGKTLDQKLKAYNPNPLYAVEIRKLMREIEAD